MDERVERGDAPSAFNLGVLYRRGLGVPRDVGEALRWWEFAARRGMPEAQNALGAAYQNGDGRPFDLGEAWAWFRLAAEGGLAVAQINSQLVASRLDPTAMARAEERLAALRASLVAPAPP